MPSPQSLGLGKCIAQNLPCENLKNLYRPKSKQNPRWIYKRQTSQQTAGVHLYLAGYIEPMLELRVIHMSCKQISQSLITQALQLDLIHCKSVIKGTAVVVLVMNAENFRNLNLVSLFLKGLSTYLHTR
jgi:hypothetical protein